MQEISTKFTLIVPTRERPDTLRYCLKNLLSLKYPNVEILVSDNFSQDGTDLVVQEFSDSRVRYLNTGKRISMSHNWEFALSHVTSGWVMFIGDDDGLLPGSLEILDAVIRDTGCQALSAASCSYIWPLHFPHSPSGELSVPLRKKSVFEVRETAEWLRKVMDGDVEYRELPWLYNGGAASIDVINGLRNPNGAFFNSINPDIYSAVALSIGLRRYAYVHVPIAVNGASKHSGGTSLMTGGGHLKGSPTHKFLAEENIPFHRALVFGKSIHIMVYECYLQARGLSETPRFDLARQIETAISLSPKVFRAEIFGDCLKMARANNVSMPSAMRVGFRRVRFAVEAIFRKIFAQRLLTVPATDLDLDNVHAASVAAKQIDSLFASIAKASTISRQLLGLFLFGLSLARYVSRVALRTKR
jgi:glycosyltransferase involved in cell wall biosynthesis